MRHERTIGVLAAGMAHDLSNFVLTVRGHAELLLAASSDDDRSSPEAILRAMDRTEDVIHQLWSIARPDASRPVVTDPTHLVDAVATMVRPAISPEVELTVDATGGGEDRISADRGQLAAELIDLVLSATDAGATRVRFRVGTEHGLDGDRNVVIEVLHDATGAARPARTVTDDGWTVLSTRRPAAQPGTTAR